MSRKLNFILMGMILILTGQIHAQKYANKLIDQIKYQDGSITLTIPNWAVDKILGETIDYPNEKDAQEFNTVKDLLGKVRFSFVEKALPLSDNLIEKLVNKDQYELYSKVKDEDSAFSLYVRSKNDKLDRILILGESDDETFAINIHSQLTLEKLEELDLSFNEARKH